MSASEPVPRLHPRLRERRVEVRRQAGRRRLRLLLGVAGTAALAGAGWGLTRSPLLDVDRVVVTGAQLTAADEVTTAAGLRPGVPMVELDERTLARRVQALPWVATATVSRAWPGTVRVRITERSAVAVIEVADRGWALVDGDGRVLDLRDAPPPDLPDIQGVDPGPTAPGATVAADARAAVEIASAAADAIDGGVRAVRFDDRGVLLELGDGTEAVLGTTEALAAKLTALSTVLSRVDRRGVVTVDVRVPGAPVLTRG